MSIKQHHRGGDYGRGDDPHGVTVNPYSKPQPLPGPYRHADGKKSSVPEYYSDPWGDE